MTVYVDTVDAIQILANAAAAIVYTPEGTDPSEALMQLKEALRYYEVCSFVSPVPAYRPRRWRCGLTTTVLEKANRFRGALATVDWRAQSPVGLADLLIGISLQVIDLREIPNVDPAVQLVATKLASVCGVAIDDDQMTDLIHECFSRAKQLEARSPQTA